MKTQMYDAPREVWLFQIPITIWALVAGLIGLYLGGPQIALVGVIAGAVGKLILRQIAALIGYKEGA